MQTGQPVIGGFDRRLTFQGRSVPKHDGGRQESTPSGRPPWLEGGLLSARNTLSTWEPMQGVEVRGGENLELSFGVWQCGADLEMHPCSRVGHVSPSASPQFLQNPARAAEVWMDEYKERFHNRNPPARKEAYGDISERKLLR
ncbi:Polypeptide N-acetylgalactosaminyltransferase 4 [Fukomys damarensis]|uniref:Polypeptide N-acetylgalactosaminyltransferase 4 n=1 Tax=Fukomys damarensis TaxID=885580 RepID=A0A091CT69_FUKDA|nr:Polypeptide N-acetylgalactosaminyltransferase 4 [Fukomys damarensis]